MTTLLLPLVRTDDPMHFERTYRRERASARLVRHDMKTWLVGQRPSLLPRYVAAAQLVVSELAANALVHGAGFRIHLDAALTPGLLRIAIQDSSREVPFIVRAGPGLHEQGNGLVVVSALCDRWGVVFASPTGKWVWAQLHLPTAGPAAAS